MQILSINYFKIRDKFEDDSELEERLNEVNINIGNI